MTSEQGLWVVESFMAGTSGVVIEFLRPDSGQIVEVRLGSEEARDLFLRLSAACRYFFE